jgi:hypothetical protein
MKPNITNTLEAGDSANQMDPTQNIHYVSTSQETRELRRGKRAHKPHSMWSDYVKE